MANAFFLLLRTVSVVRAHFSYFSFDRCVFLFLSLQKTAHEYLHALIGFFFFALSEFRILLIISFIMAEVETVDFERIVQTFYWAKINLANSYWWKIPWKYYCWLYSKWYEENIIRADPSNSNYVTWNFHFLYEYVIKMCKVQSLITFSTNET